MAMVNYPNSPKPIRNAPIVMFPCENCKKLTPHYMFTTDANYVGPIIFMPLSKLAPKHTHIICEKCLNKVELKEENAKELLQESTPNPFNDEVQDAICECYKKITNCAMKKSSIFYSNEKYQADLQVALKTYMLKITMIEEKRSDSKTKRCPYCKEEIRADAIKCRYCGADLSNEV